MSWKFQGSQTKLDNPLGLINHLFDLLQNILTKPWPNLCQNFHNWFYAKDIDEWIFEKNNEFKKFFEMNDMKTFKT